MLRLAHRLLSQGLPALQTDMNVRLLKAVVSGLAMSPPVFIADNVAQYAEDELDKDKNLEDTLIGKTCVPPFSKVFVEYDLPEFISVESASCSLGKLPRAKAGLLQAGVFMFENNDQGQANLQDAGFDWPVNRDAIKRIYYGIACLTTPHGLGLVLPTLIQMFFDKNGAYLGFLRRGNSGHSIAYPADATDAFRHRALMALAFTHCGNVKKVDATESEGPPRKWCRRMKVPELKYHVLQIDPNISGKPRRESEPDGLDRSGKALHICRGHFRTYAEGGPGLFGTGRTGTFWVPSHKRGSSAHGHVMKDYSVGAPNQ